MIHIKTPFSAIDMVTRILVVDADLEPLFNVVDQVHIPDPSAVATEIVLAVNAHDALLAACREAREHLFHMRQERGFPGEAWDYEKAQEILAQAIALAENKIEGEGGAE